MSLSNFPDSLDTFTDKTDNVDDVMAADINKLQDAVEALQGKVGIDSSAVVTSLEYILKNASSQNPGHKHNLAAGATDVTATADEVNKLAGVTGGTASANKALVLGASKDVDELAIGTMTGNVVGNVTGNADTATSAGTATTVSDSAISQAKLKTSSGSVTATASNATLPGGEFGFYPQVKCGSGGMQVTSRISQAQTSTSYVTNIYLDQQGAGSVYAQQRYVTASGEVFWIFILRDKDTKEIKAAWQAPDHPCFGNGGKPKLVPHPFPDYDPETQEIVVVNPSREEVAEMRAACDIDDDNIPDRDLIQVILEDYEIDEESSPAWPSKKVSVSLKNNQDWSVGKVTEVIKKSIPKPDGILVRRLKKR